MPARTMAPIRVLSLQPPETDREHEPDQDDTETTCRIGESGDLHRPVQQGGGEGRARLRCPDPDAQIRQDEREPPGDENLLVEPLVESGEAQPFDDQTDKSGQEASGERAEPKTEPQPDRYRPSHVCAHHVHGAVRQVEHAHHAHNQGQPRGEKKQDHPVRDAVQHIEDKVGHRNSVLSSPVTVDHELLSRSGAVPGFGRLVGAGIKRGVARRPQREPPPKRRRSLPPSGLSRSGARGRGVRPRAVPGTLRRCSRKPHSNRRRG